MATLNHVREQVREAGDHPVPGAHGKVREVAGSAYSALDALLDACHRTAFLETDKVLDLISDKMEEAA